MTERSTVMSMDVPESVEYGSTQFGVDEVVGVVAGGGLTIDEHAVELGVGDGDLVQDDLDGAGPFRQEHGEAVVEAVGERQALDREVAAGLGDEQTRTPRVGVRAHRRTRERRTPPDEREVLRSDVADLVGQLDDGVRREDDLGDGRVGVGGLDGREELGLVGYTRRGRLRRVGHEPRPGEGQRRECGDETDLHGSPW